MISHGAWIVIPTALSLALAVTGCAQGPRTRVAPPEPGLESGAMAPPAQPPAAAEGADASSQHRVGETQWIKPGNTSQEMQADLESCYSYAQAQTDHDRRIERDSDAAFDAFPSGLGLTRLRGDMNEFGRKNRRASLFSSCMASKGYARN